jgi:hypothetical protein
MVAEPQQLTLCCFPVHAFTKLYIADKSRKPAIGIVGTTR